MDLAYEMPWAIEQNKNQITQTYINVWVITRIMLIKCVF